MCYVHLARSYCCREEVMKFVKSLHGFGDYAAGNVAMLLGFYAEVPLDSETVRRPVPRMMHTHQDR